VFRSRWSEACGFPVGGLKLGSSHVVGCIGSLPTMDGFGDKVGFIWSVADLLRGDYKAHEYGRVILPLS
jgi:hypothetical protein